MKKKKIALKKLFHLHGFYSLLVFCLLLISIIIMIMTSVHSTAHTIANDFILLFFIMPLFPILAFILALVGLHKDKPKTLAIIGLVTSILMLAIALLLLFFRNPV